MAKRRPAGDGMVRKRDDGRWEGRIVVGHKKNGEPIYRYIFAKTQSELIQKLHDKIEMYRDANLSEDCNITLGEWLDKWLYGKREAHNIYAKTREECEEKLAAMIVEVKAKIKAEKERLKAVNESVTVKSQ